MITVITDIIVVASALSAVAFIVAWIRRPDLRTRIERPKYTFLEGLERYDRQSRDNPTDKTR